MKSLLLLLCLVSMAVEAADINRANPISCIGDDSALKGTFQKQPTRKASAEVRQRFSEWLFAENFHEYNSRLKFIWAPKGKEKASIEIVTSEKNHHQVEIRSQRKNSLIVVSNASDPLFNLESWSFALNFGIESLVATRVQSNVAALKAGVMTYNCFFEAL